MTPRSPLTALPGERLAGIGHNQGPPLDPGQSWRQHCWTKARRELLPRLPLEVVRRRIARARQLGLEYPQYASILLGSGRDIVAFLFTSDSLGLRLGRTVDVPRPVVDKLAGLEGCDRLLAAEAPADPAALAPLLAAEAGISFAGVSALPAGPDLTWRQGRDAVRNALAPLKLPGNAVVMVGTRAHERDWADAAQLAKFLPADQYFPGA